MVAKRLLTVFDKSKMEVPGYIVDNEEVWSIRSDSVFRV